MEVLGKLSLGRFPGPTSLERFESLTGNDIRPTNQGGITCRSSSISVSRFYDSPERLDKLGFLSHGPGLSRHRFLSMTITRSGSLPEIHSRSNKSPFTKEFLLSPVFQNELLLMPRASTELTLHYLIRWNDSPSGDHGLRSQSLSSLRSGNGRIHEYVCGAYFSPRSLSSRLLGSSLTRWKSHDNP